jgi:hypothetical protein
MGWALRAGCEGLFPLQGCVSLTSAVSAARWYVLCCVVMKGYHVNANVATHVSSAVSTLWCNVMCGYAPSLT